MGSNQDVAVFVNIPFCIEVPRLTHGHFFVGDSAAKTEYMEALSRELASSADLFEGKRVVAVHIGGGSPSVMSPDQLGSLMREMRASLPLVPGAEMSMEAIPNTVGVPSLTGWGQGKPNRIDLRVRAINQRDLAELEPPYRVSDIQNAVLFLDKFGMNNLSVVLTCGIPDQTATSWGQTLRSTLDFEPREVFVELVTPADGVGLKKTQQQELYAQAQAFLEERGLVEYAAGRFARPGSESAFHRALCEGADVVGLGADAVSRADGMVWRNTQDFETYCASSDDAEKVVCDARQLDVDAQVVAYVHETLRLREGVSEENCRARWGMELPQVAVDLVEAWQASGLVEKYEGCVRLTQEGRFAWLWGMES